MTSGLPYRDPTRTIDERIDDLLGRMTIEEKIGQMLQLDGRVNLEEEFKEKHPGSFLQILGEDVIRATHLARESRLGIPLLFGVDAIHGHSFWPGATIFPTQLGMACSWNETLMEEAAAITAREMRNTGPAWTFSPVLCLTHDLRWGRVGETFGEDPYLIGRFAAAMIRGYQGDDLSLPDKVVACAKHYAGYSETQGGRDASEADLSQRKLRSYFLPPFEQAARAGVCTYMTGYQSMEGLPSTANRWLLREVLKDEWGFDGFLVTDWNNVGSMVRSQKICADFREAAALAIECGNDLIMATPEFYHGALDALDAGLVSEELVDDAVRRILRIKFRLGLFEDDRMPDLEAIEVGRTEDRNVALQAARESIVLLKNDKLLPLNESKLKKIAVLGPNTDDTIAQLGDWSAGTGQANAEKVKCHPRETVVTLLDGLRERFAGELVYERGCGILEPELDKIPAAVKAAEDADVAVVVVGDCRQLWGEWQSTATLELQGGQIELLDAIAETRTPMIVALVHSKPAVLPQSALEAAAIVELFSPGMLGGQAFAEILMGDVNPSGRLTISVPYHVGQQPVFYSQVRGQHGNQYADMTQQPAFAFGEGLSYTSFEYGELTLEEEVLQQDDSLRATVAVTNTGDCAGVEVVQAYVSDLVTSATWVDKELKAFERVSIPAGETKVVRIAIPINQCSLVNARGERVVEPGEFELLVGKSSRDPEMRRATFRVE